MPSLLGFLVPFLAYLYIFNNAHLLLRFNRIVVFVWTNENGIR